MINCTSLSHLIPRAFTAPRILVFMGTRTKADMVEEKGRVQACLPVCRSDT
jgi:hypothetical protein